MDREPTEILMRGLARAVARGRSVIAWARQNEVNIEVAREWSQLPDFRQNVEADRFDICDRMAGKLARISSRAIDRLVEISERSGLSSVSVSATNALLKNWIEVSKFFVMEKKMEVLTAQIKVAYDKMMAIKNPAYVPR